jgi:hypothetical protein
LAADQLIPGVDPKMLLGGLNGTVVAIFWIVIILAIGLLIFFVWWYFSFKFNIVIRDVVNGRKIIKYDKAKVVSGKTGIHFWKFRGLGDRVPEPPSRCIEVDSKGRKFCEFYRLSDGTLIPGKDEFEEQNIKKDFPQFKPFPTEQRALQVHELEESESYKKKKFGEILVAIAPYVAILLVLIVFMIFFNDVVAPTVQLGNNLVSASEKLSNSLDTINGLIGNSTKLKAEYRPIVAPGAG